MSKYPVVAYWYGGIIHATYLLRENLKIPSMTDTVASYYLRRIIPCFEKALKEI